MAFIDNDVAIVRDEIRNDALLHQTLYQRHVDDACWLLLRTVDDTDGGRVDV
jgi:hypothetical protein